MKNGWTITRVQLWFYSKWFNCVANLGLDQDIEVESNPKSIAQVKPQLKKKRKLNSRVWEYLKKVDHIKDLVGNIVEMAQCIYYKEFYNCKWLGGTGHLNRHKCVSKHTDENIDPVAEGSGTRTLLSHGSSSSSFKSF